MSAVCELVMPRFNGSFGKPTCAVLSLTAQVRPWWRLLVSVGWELHVKWRWSWMFKPLKLITNLPYMKFMCHGAYFVWISNHVASTTSPFGASLASRKMTLTHNEHVSQEMRQSAHCTSHCETTYSPPQRQLLENVFVSAENKKVFKFRCTYC